MSEAFSMIATPPVQIEALKRRFDARVAIDELSLDVPRGRVFGLIGGNCAGKTTLLRHVLGALKAQTGSVRVFGLDPVTRPIAVLGRISYLSADRSLPNWLRVKQLMQCTQAFFPTGTIATPRNCAMRLTWTQR